MTASDRVVVVGAGVSGLAVARDLAPDHEVIVLDKGGVAADTSSRASGMISLSLEPFPEEWATYALDRFRALDGSGVFSFTEHPTVRFVPAADADHYADAAPEGGRYLDVDGLRARFPDSFADLSSYGGGIVYEGTGYLDALDYAMTLKWAAEREGAAVYRDHAVTGLRVADGEVVGVETEYGDVDADHVVWATGWRGRDHLADHVELPTRPLRWNAVVVEPETPLPANAPLGSEPDLRVYWRPTQRGNVLVGGNEHLLEDPESAEMRVDPAFRETVEEEVAPIIAGLENGTVRREDCCPSADAASPDGRPIVDAPAEAPDGLVVVAGLHGRGVMLSPVTGRAVRSLVTGEAAPFPTGPLAVDRFDDRSPEFEYVSHWD